ncbi:hypothetical protein [Nocardia terpenica]|uniref:Antitoxin HicB n=1 Tax=Nocardia terpenica TaxID=455432 RepID=A0A291RL74_9NOCA|nr:hypothetical protein [Nocardia terpenica]ATL68127.1 hypothetical protein CRH09_19995 [Nocardia terpenica]
MGDIDHEFSKVAYRVRWSPPDRVFIAFTDNFPELSATGDWPLQALHALQASIRRVLEANAAD